MNRDYALLDAALSRAREGIRTLEESARFVLKHEVAKDLKLLRHELQTLDREFGQAALLNARRQGEAKPAPFIKTEGERFNLLSIIRANSNRVTETLRELEEFAKIYARHSAPAMAAARYKIYQAELTLSRLTPHYWLDWYNVGGFIYPISPSPDELINYIKKGARVVQLRDKTAKAATYFSAAERLAVFVTAFNRRQEQEKVLVILNDHADIAARLPVAGVHLGQSDISTASARRLIGSNKIIGRSNNSLLELQKSIDQGADYVSFGPVFSTPNKPQKAPVGAPLLAEAVSLSPVPVVAIGGITPERISDLYVTGAKNLAVISAAKDFYS